MTRRTFEEVAAEATERSRNDTIAEVCRILRWHLDMQPAADALWDEMQKPTPKVQANSDRFRARAYSPFDWVSF